MYKKYASILALALAGAVLAAPVAAQSFSVGSSSVQEGTPETSVTWNYTSGGGVFSVVFDIPIDMDFIVPQTTVDFLGQLEVDGCLPTPAPAANAFCYLLEDTGGLYAGASHFIRVTLINNLPNQVLASSGGTFTFDIAATAVEGDSWPLEAIEIPIQTQPEGATIATTDGLVEIVGSDANLSIAPASRDFGSLDILAPALSQVFTVSNTGEADAVTGITIPGLAAPFAITANTCGATLAPGANCAITVSFDPTAVGSFNATLAVNSDANNVSAALQGAGTATPNIAVTPPFGPVNLGLGQPGQVLTANGNVVNTGSGDGTVQCNLVQTGQRGNGMPPAGVFSTTLPLGDVVTVVAGAPAIPFSVSCALPEDAADGETFTGEIQCSVNGDSVGPASTHFLSCSVQEFQAVPIPTMQTWGLILFALMMLLVGGITIRFFRV